MLTIVWDVDDVLNDLMRSWFEMHWIPSHPECRLCYDDIKENPPNRLLGIDIDEYLRSLDAFRLSNIYPNLPPVQEVLAWFQNYGEFFKHIVLTSAPLFIVPTSAAWVIKNFGRWIRSFNFIPSNRENEDLPVYSKSKVDYLRWLCSVDIFIDDLDTNIKEAEALGIYGILMPRPWNHSKLTIIETLGSLSKFLP